MFKRHLFLLVAFLLAGTLSAQTVEEMTALKESKSAELDSLQTQLDALTTQVETLTTEVEDLTDQIEPYPRWEIGGHGNIGINFSQYSDWLSKSSPNTAATSVGFTGKGFVNLDQEKFFWRNTLNLAIGWQRFKDDDDPLENGEYDVASDVFSFKSLYGHKISDKWAVSGLGEYRSTLLENINNPGYLDIGGGMTWSGAKDLVVVVHPVNYNFVFSDGPYEYQSSLGAKIVADYKIGFLKHFAWTTNFSSFLSYEGKDLSNWYWINGITSNVKGFGLGIDFGFGSNRQEALADALASNPLQFFWVFGLTYSI